MPDTIPQSILDALTDVHIARGFDAPAASDHLDVDGLRVPVFRTSAVVLGSGAAGLRAAVELARRGVDTLVATRKLFWGTSAFSGSDKQTLHTACTKHRGDDFTKMAQALGAGGAMDADTAYVEAVGSIDALSGLRFLGLPLPEDRFGAVLRYQTDHDEFGRATSCGPRTSRLMVKVLADEARRLRIPVLDHATGVAIAKEGSGGGERTVGLVLACRTVPDNPFGLCLVASPHVVLASGGPGELFRDSVYPKNCFGSLGMALEAGLRLTNLTEHQFGIGTRRSEFPWNLSGTYVQVIPRVYSTDAEGREREFLGDCYRTTQELASNVFRKGYQWPFHAQRTRAFGSSLVDVAIHRETQAGRTVWLDFTRNPSAVPGDLPFDLGRLDPDVRAYLESADALAERPIDRLRRMNPLAIELYRHYRIDIATDPLPFNVNHQHMNGGVDVDVWARTSLEGCYAVGEVAGTHGVTRPGGAALNAGQVFAHRCAEHIHARNERGTRAAEAQGARPALARALGWLRRNVGNADGLPLREVAEEVQRRMSDCAGFVCHADRVAPALAEARALNRRIAERGLSIPGRREISEGVCRAQIAALSEAMLAALDHYVRSGGGSRGARMLCSPRGTEVPEARNGPLEDYRFVAENPALRGEQIVVQRHADGTLGVSTRPLRGIEDTGRFFFEKHWGAYLTGAIFP